MARARNIKPAILDNPELADCGSDGYVVFTGLWMHVDRYGVMKYHDSVVRKIFFLYPDINPISTIQALCKYGFVFLYEFEGVKYLQVAKFNKHQNPHMKEQPQDYPHHPSCCCGWENCKHHTTTILAPDKTGTSPADSLNLIPDSLVGAKPPTKKNEGKKKSKFIPHDFPVSDDLRRWCAKETPDVMIDEQMSIIRLTEFPRAYSDWGRVVKKWMRGEQIKASRYKRNRQNQDQPPELTVDQKANNQRHDDLLAEQDKLWREATSLGMTVIEARGKTIPELKAYIEVNQP